VLRRNRGRWVGSGNAARRRAKPAPHRLSPPSPCRMVLRAAALAMHACLLAALRPSDPNVCSYWER